MKFVYQMTYRENLAELVQAGVEEVILCSNTFSRFGELSVREVEALARELKDLGIRVVFSFDILMTEALFIEKIQQLRSVDLTLFDAVRVQDPGVLYHFLQLESALAIQLILETGNHNTIGVKQWAQIVGPRLDRLVLSLEWPKTELFKLLSETQLPCEIMGLGPILLFYTPRSLVKPLLKSEGESFAPDTESLRFMASSEESPHKGFDVLENSHGTFMFHPKHHGLLDEVLALKEAGLDAFRLELLKDDDRSVLPLFGAILKAREQAEVITSEALLRAQYSHALIKGFYKANKSNVLFKKLKNERLRGRDESFVGVVLDYKKGRSLAVQNLHPKRSVRVGESLRFLSTEGKTRELKLARLTNLQGEEIDSLAPGKIGLFPHVSSMSVKSQIFWLE